MHFPPINAVDDGIFLYCFLAYLSGRYGSEFWYNKVTLFDTHETIVYFVKYAFVFTFPIYGINAIRNIYLNRNTKKM